MTKENLKEIMKRNCILDCEVDDTMNFVQDLFEFLAKEIEATEPYAVNCIKRLRDAAYEVWNLQGYVENIMEE